MKHFARVLVSGACAVLLPYAATSARVVTTTSSNSTAAASVRTDNNDASAPKTPPGEASFIGGASAATIPFTLSAAGNIRVPVTVNGHQLYFILDSGNINSLSRQAARAAGVHTTGSVQAEGGGGAVRVSFAKVKSLVIGGKVALTNQTWVVVPLPQASPTQPLDGTIGYGTLKHFVVRVNYSDREVTFIRPDRFDPKTAGAVVPLTFFGGKLPVAAGSLDGLPGHFFVDTGAGLFSLAVASHFARNHRLYTRYKATPAMVTGISTGGAVSDRVARGEAFTLGRFIVRDPVVLLQVGGSGLMASKTIDGDIGGRILRRFTVTFDYPAQRMYLEPNKYFGRPMNYDRSGMAVIGSAKGFSVMGVMPSGPAAQSGIKPGDVITSVNGTPANQLALVKFISMLRDGPLGSHVELNVAGSKVTHTLTLRRLIPATAHLG